jgi:predicted nucleotidyltransferase
MSEKQTSEKPPESPTTAHNLDFDDEGQETGTTATSATQAITPQTAPVKKVAFSEEEAPPAKPPRPMDPQIQNVATLKEAFPSIDEKVIKAVLTASGGQLEPAFNALLGMKYGAKILQHET